MRIARLTLALLFTVVTGCEPGADSSGSQSPNEPKTFFGQSVKKARDASDQAAERNASIMAEEEQLGDEEATGQE